MFRPEKTVSVEQHRAKLQEDGVKLDLTVVRKLAFLAALAALYLPLVNITLLILQYDPPHLAI